MISSTMNQKGEMMIKKSTPFQISCSVSHHVQNAETKQRYCFAAVDQKSDSLHEDQGCFSNIFKLMSCSVLAFCLSVR